MAPVWHGKARKEGSGEKNWRFSPLYVTLHTPKSTIYAQNICSLKLPLYKKDFFSKLFLAYLMCRVYSNFNSTKDKGETNEKVVVVCMFCSRIGSWCG